MFTFLDFHRTGSSTVYQIIKYLLFVVQNNCPVSKVPASLTSSVDIYMISGWVKKSLDTVGRKEPAYVF